MSTTTQALRITRRGRGPTGVQRFGDTWRSVPPQARAELLRAADTWGDARLSATLHKVPAQHLGTVFEYLARGNGASGHLLMRLSEAGAIAHLEAHTLKDLLGFLRGPRHEGFAARWREGALRFGQHLLRTTFAPHVHAQALAERIEAELYDPRVPIYLLEARARWPRGLVCFGPPTSSNSPSLGEWRRSAVSVLKAPDPCIEAHWPDAHDISRCRYEGHRARISCAHAGQLAARLDSLLHARQPRDGLLRLAEQALLTTGRLATPMERVAFEPGQPVPIRELPDT